ncbi:MAG TPA: DinB family protein [Panacibacter sp.]|nr:DinB family protein [Panacibacter sp.]
MTKQEIIQRLKENHQSFTSFISLLDEKDFLFTVNDKWTPGQQAEHILRAVKPVVLAFRLPLFLLMVIFGNANRPSRSYAGLADRYHEKLAGGGKASGRFIPPSVAYNQKNKTCCGITNAVEALCNNVAKVKEEDLDNYILPHPLFGKLTMREMLYFTIYHVYHHQNNIKELLKLRQSV